MQDCVGTFLTRLTSGSPWSISVWETLKLSGDSSGVAAWHSSSANTSCQGCHVIAALLAKSGIKLWDAVQGFCTVYSTLSRFVTMDAYCPVQLCWEKGIRQFLAYQQYHLHVICKQSNKCDASSKV